MAVALHDAGANILTANIYLGDDHAVGKCEVNVIWAFFSLTVPSGSYAGNPC